MSFIETGELSKQILETQRELKYVKGEMSSRISELKATLDTIVSFMNVAKKEIEEFKVQVAGRFEQVTGHPFTKNPEPLKTNEFEAGFMAHRKHCDHCGESHIMVVRARIIGSEFIRFCPLCGLRFDGSAQAPK